MHSREVYYFFPLRWVCFTQRILPRPLSPPCAAAAGDVLLPDEGGVPGVPPGEVARRPRRPRQPWGRPRTALPGRRGEGGHPGPDAGGPPRDGEAGPGAPSAGAEGGREARTPQLPTECAVCFFLFMYAYACKNVNISIVFFSVGGQVCHRFLLLAERNRHPKKCVQQKNDMLKPREMHLGISPPPLCWRAWLPHAILWIH